MRKRFAIIFAIVIVVAGAAVAARVALDPAQTVLTQRDVVYATNGDVRLAMDIVRPRNVPASSVLPVVICIHGGGWSSGKRQDMLGFAYGVANLGIEVVTVDYRLSQQAHYPSQMDDLMAAARYLRAHENELHIDTNKMAAIGSSAGAHLALLLAERSWDGAPASQKHPSMLRGVISIAGPTDLTNDIPAQCVGVVQGLMGCSPAKHEAAYKQASPIHSLTPQCAPVLLVHGDKDPIVPYGHATRFLTECQRLGVSAELVTLHGGGHGSGGDQNETKAGVQKMADFLVRCLKS